MNLAEAKAATGEAAPSGFTDSWGALGFSQIGMAWGFESILF